MAKILFCQTMLKFLASLASLATVSYACDFETLVTECTPPTAIQDSAYCGQYVTYKDCASKVGCVAK